MMEQEESGAKFTPVTKNGIGFGVLAIFIIAIFTAAVIGGLRLIF